MDSIIKIASFDPIYYALIGPPCLRPVETNTGPVIWRNPRSERWCRGLTVTHSGPEPPTGGLVGWHLKRGTLTDCSHLCIDLQWTGGPKPNQKDGPSLSGGISIFNISPYLCRVFFFTIICFPSVFRSIGDNNISNIKQTNTTVPQAMASKINILFNFCYNLSSLPCSSAVAWLNFCKNVFDRHIGLYQISFKLKEHFQGRSCVILFVVEWTFLQRRFVNSTFECDSAAQFSFTT